jgi:hypothetical protein
MDTLAVRLAVPLTGPAEDFPFMGHFRDVRPAGRTLKKPEPKRSGFSSYSIYIELCIQWIKKGIKTIP